MKYGSFISSDAFPSPSRGNGIAPSFRPTPSFAAPSSSSSANNGNTSQIDTAGSYLLDVNDRNLKVVGEVVNSQYASLMAQSTAPNNDAIIGQLACAYDVFPEELDGVVDDSEASASSSCSERSAPIATLIDSWRQSLALNERSLMAASSAAIRAICDYKPELHYYDTSDEKSRVDAAVDDALHWWGIRPETLLLTEIVQRCPKRPPPPPPPPPPQPPALPLPQANTNHYNKATLQLPNNGKQGVSETFFSLFCSAFLISPSIDRLIACICSRQP